jgi:hypothetical protein
MQLEVSDDMGEVFDDLGAQPLGRQGERNTRLMWTRCGKLHRPGRVHRWRTTQPVTIRKAKYNETLR